MTTINPLHFRSELGATEAKELFKNSVKNIEIAISSFCNRRCTYCPNSLHDRRSKHIYMNDELFDQLMYELAEIEYDGRIALHRYNEPLANPEYALKRIWQIRAMIPKAEIWIYSNGDYLTPKLINALEKSGISQLLVTSHALPKDQQFETIQGRMHARLKKIGLPYQDHGLSQDRSEHWISVQTNSQMQHQWRAINFKAHDSEGHLKMSDRGESLNIQTTFIRSSPCLIPFTEMQIEYDGSVWPCCNVHSDVPEHQAYLMGKISPSDSLFSVYTNKTFVQWRKSLFDFGEKEKPCKTCNFIPGSLPIEAKEQVQKIRQEFGLNPQQQQI